jgi:hypothetical protein
MAKPVYALVLFLVCASAGLAQNPAPPAANSASAGDNPAVQSRMNDLLGRISSLPPEYKADLGFTIMDAAPRLLSPAQKRSLLDDIFHSAVRSHYPYRLTEVSSQGGRARAEASLLQASRLDTLDIQAGVVERALPQTPQLASHLFEEIKPNEDRASCMNTSVEDVSAFYVTAAKVIADKRIRSLSAEDKNAYLFSLVTNMRVPAEIAPLAKLVTEASLPADQLSQVEGAFVSALSAITASDREMAAAEEGGNLTEAINQLSVRLAQSGVDPGRLLAAYRGFLVRNLTPESCADQSLDRAEVARNFNALLPNPPASSPDLAPLTAAELASESRGVSAPDQALPYNDRVMAKLERIAKERSVRFDEEKHTGQPSTMLPASSDEDEDDVIKYALAIEPAGAECPFCDFVVKAALLHALVSYSPSGSQLEKAANAQVDFLSFNEMEKNNPVAWLHFLKELINVSAKPKDAATAALVGSAKDGSMLPWAVPSDEAGAVRKILRGSSDSVVSAYLATGDLLHLGAITPARGQ